MKKISFKAFKEKHKQLIEDGQITVQIIDDVYVKIIAVRIYRIVSGKKSMDVRTKETIARHLKQAGFKFQPDNPTNLSYHNGAYIKGKLKA